MTERKPKGVSYETWIDRQIREAEERGAFDNLTGAGKPIADLDQPRDDLWWVKQLLHREQLSYLPPTLALRKEVEDVRVKIATLPSEKVVREVVDTLNKKIIDAIRKPSSGPPLNLMPLDVDDVLEEWRQSHGET